ncbi:PAS domain-containing sensor histidine kinase [Pseudomonas sp.]|uniref:PAS domain-containing sensor histidine kinase n=1 Tax=Pseudomonas sp. TaxID=306 RepID=UPI0026318560|nr:PAS domain-containing sensor histidine kinase [Pseudomonas sp.]
MLLEPPLLPDSDSLWEAAACGLLLTSATGSIERANLTFCHWVGLSQSELQGRRFQELLTMGDRIFHQTHWAPLLQMQGSVTEVKLDLVHKDGHSIPMMLNAVRREHPTTGIFHELAIFIAEDRNRYERELVAARKLAEERLLQQLQAQRALTLAQDRLSQAHADAEIRATFAEQMVGIVSHDLRNPLAAIKMAADMLARNEQDEKRTRIIGHVTHSANRAQRLIADLLDFTQARVGRGIVVNPQAIDLHAVVASCVEELSMTFSGRGLIHRHVGATRCVADGDRLHQAIGNLVANAMTYGDPDKAVTVTSAVEAEGVVITVHNQGVPIPAPLLANLFEPMIRGVDGGDEVRSVGLGLFIVREIARAHHGNVQVTSTLEPGTVFIISLP